MKGLPIYCRQHDKWVYPGNEWLMSECTRCCSYDDWLVCRALSILLAQYCQSAGAALEVEKEEA